MARRVKLSDNENAASFEVISEKGDTLTVRQDATKQPFEIKANMVRSEENVEG